MSDIQKERNNTNKTTDKKNNTDPTPTNRPGLPSISLPKGGGAIRGIGEKFASNPVTGTASLSVPIFTSPGRSGFGPQLSLSYDSGSGNNIFGLGWNLSIPSITRKTDKGLPKYQDEKESDVFIISDAEDLVPTLVQIGTKWQHEYLPHRSIDGVNYRVQRYRPRIEGLFARIERWSNSKTGEIHWRSISKDNITTLYGKTIESRIYDPQDPTRIFRWLICESYDDKGNAILYQYKPENSQGVDLSSINERNRTDKSRSANRYLKRVKYGNKIPCRKGADLSGRTDWMFEVVFDYGEHYSEDEHNSPVYVSSSEKEDDMSHQWKIRRDPFSIYRSGFEIRTYRRCQRVLMFHHFPDELGIDDYLVRSTEFTYKQDPIASFITHISQSGYVYGSDGIYIKKSLPPLEFEYSQAIIKDEIKEIDTSSLENLPSGLDGMQYQWVDLDGEGLSGILTEQAGAWFYKHNLGSLPIVKTSRGEVSASSSDNKAAVFARFAPLQREESIPSFSDLNNGQQQLLDLEGDGKIDLVKFDRPVSGYFKRSQDGEDWEPFIPFPSLPSISWNDPNLKFIDLTGDGHQDILITEDGAFAWYQSLAQKGFGENVETVFQSLDEEKGPRLVFADGTQSIYLADMSGDGLTDLARIRNGEVCYWPNLGYGKFGAKVTMNNSPWFDNPDQFDQKRIRLADIDGSGTTDIIYISREGIHIFRNECGNSLSGIQKLNNQFPHVDSLSSSMMVADLLGNGTACLVWSSSLPSDGSRTMFYVDLMGGVKPHLLISMKNNMGAETKVQYAPSTKFYLADKLAGKPWITKIPFPVQVVERVGTYDQISRTRLVSRYAYHHGYFDGVEREFRGFGFVEQWDTESFDLFNELSLFSIEDTAPNDDSDALSKKEGKGFHVPPILIKTWFHTGAYIEKKLISQHFAEKEYYKENDGPQANLLSDSFLPDGLVFNEETEAYRALKGKILRQEIYSEDNVEQSVAPYSVTDHNYQLRLIQPIRDGILHAVFYPHERETISFYYERNPEDPRVQHQFILDVDEYGNVQKQATVYYPRRKPSTPEQSLLKAIVNLTDYAKIVDNPDIWITGVPCQSKLLEISDALKLRKDESGKYETRLQFSNIETGVTLALNTIVDFGDNFHRNDDGRTPFQARIFHWERNYFWNDSHSDISELGSIAVPVLPSHKETAVFPVSYFDKIYGKTIITDIIVGKKIVEEEGGYHQDMGYWWDKGIRQYYLDKELFYLPYITVDQFGSFDPITETGSYYQLEYDLKYQLVPVRLSDPLKNVILADIDYRVLNPKQVIDINDNTSQVFYDELGVVVASTIFGHEDDVLKGDGDLYTSTPTSTEFNLCTDTNLKDVLVNPQKYIQNATSFFYYDYLSWKNDGIPLHAVSVQREVHITDRKSIEKHSFKFAILYGDGMGRELQKKLKVEEGLAWVKHDDGSYKEQISLERWLTSGDTVYNNKGKPVKLYEPFYSASPDYESEKSLTQFGVTPIIHYDPLERVIRTDTPKGFFSCFFFGPWTQEHWDQNDNVKQSRFYDELINHDKHPTTWTPERIDAEKKALYSTESHANTSKIIHVNNLAQLFLEEDAVGDNKLYTYSEIDINGNKLAITDPRQYENNKSRSADKKVKNFKFKYDMLNRQLQSISTDAGITTSFQNCLNNPIYVWNARNFVINTKYDPLQRLIRVNVKEGDGTDSLNNVVEKIQYGESEVDPKRNNLRGKPVKHYEQAGTKDFLIYDIEGHNIKSVSKLRDEYKKEANWDIETEPSSSSFISESNFDALGRLVRRKQSDLSIHEPKYHQSGLLKSVAVKLVSDAEFKNYVNDIQYNAKGQRLSIRYGNGTITKYDYEPETFRLVSLKTIRSSDSKVLQEISYVYDPVGNITYLKDASHRTIFSNQTKVDPVSTYAYDSIYRLTHSNGRQHPAIKPDDYKNPSAFKQSRYLSFDSVSINDSTALENYCQIYQYDLASNLEQIIHSVTGESSHGWTRKNTFADDSNKINSSTIGGDTENFTFDLAGNMNQFEHLREINWNYRNNISSVVLVKRGEEAAKNDSEYYVYGNDGMRIRKVTERYIKVGENEFLDVEEKIYLDGYEIRRIKRINLKTMVPSLDLERYSCNITDDKNRIVILHRWNIDSKKRETDDLIITKVHYQLGNHLGSSSLELDENERIISYEEYYPYGGTSFIAGKSLVSSLPREVSIKEYRYTGKELDDSTRLYYHGARYYIQWLARWISSDPMGIIDGPNLYVYGNGNPIMAIDLTGTQASPAPAGVVTAPSPYGPKPPPVYGPELPPVPPPKALPLYGEGPEIKLGPVQPSHFVTPAAKRPSVSQSPIPPNTQPPAADTLNQGTAGVAYGTVQTLTPGGFMAPSPAPHSRTFEFFRAAGQVATGVAVMFLGIKGTIAGGAMSTTGAGAIVGVPVMTISMAVVAQGAVSIVGGIGTAWNAISGEDGLPEGTHKIIDENDLNKDLTSESTHSEALGKALERKGDLKPAEGYEAHHIVPSKDPRGAEARKILEEAGIDLDSASNGVWLPKTAKGGTVAEAFTEHAPIHTDDYYEMITQRLLEGGPDNAWAVLNDLKVMISLGHFR